MGTPVSNMLMGQGGGVANQAAQIYQQQEAERMRQVAAGGQPGPPTVPVQDAQASVSAGTQNPTLGLIAEFLTKLGLAGGAPATGPAPQAQMMDPVSAVKPDEYEDEQARREKLRKAGIPAAQ